MASFIVPRASRPEPKPRGSVGLLLAKNKGALKASAPVAKAFSLSAAKSNLQESFVSSEVVAECHNGGLHGTRTKEAVSRTSTDRCSVIPGIAQSDDHCENFVPDGSASLELHFQELMSSIDDAGNDGMAIRDSLLESDFQEAMSSPGDESEGEPAPSIVGRAAAPHPPDPASYSQRSAEYRAKAARNIPEQAPVAFIREKIKPSVQVVKRYPLNGIVSATSKTTTMTKDVNVTGPAPGIDASDTLKVQIAEAHWPREDGSWSKKYYQCHIIDWSVDGNGDEMYTVAFIQDRSRADVPSKHLRFLLGDEKKNCQRQGKVAMGQTTFTKESARGASHTHLECELQEPKVPKQCLDRPSNLESLPEFNDVSPEEKAALKTATPEEKAIYERILKQTQKRAREVTLDEEMGQELEDGGELCDSTVSTETVGDREMRTAIVFMETAQQREGRLPSLGEVPQFDERAEGVPLQWNKEKPLIWSRRAKNRPVFAKTIHSTIDESLERVKRFFEVRYDEDNIPILSKLNKNMQTDGRGWHRFEWVPFELKGGRSALPKTSPGEYGGGRSDWQTAWHGCKFEALYSIMYHGRLFASCDAERGDRFFGNAPGVYVHKDETCFKCGNYLRFVPLCRDGVFWAALWEVMVDRSDRVPVKKTDQWVQQERSVQLAALWLVGCTYEAMTTGWEVSEIWDPLLEAHPKKRQRQKSPADTAENHLQDKPEDPEPQAPRCHLHMKRRKNCKFCNPPTDCPITAPAAVFPAAGFLSSLM